jgi:hypothetical protein
MNFFGHAWVAGWFSVQPPFILGAMLPDFASALRVAAPTSRHPELDAGIRLHHVTDRVFHGSEAFSALEQGARVALSDAGLPKGARRALAHVGVEYLIDEQLALRAPAWCGYELALRFGSSAACRADLTWSAAHLSERFASFCQRLELSSRPAGSARLAARLVVALAGRPRLALQPEDEARVEPWLEQCRPHVVALMPRLLAELTRDLGAPDGALPRAVDAA